MNLVILPDYFLSDIEKIPLEDSFIEIGEKRFIAVGIEKSKTSEDLEESDQIRLTVLVRGDNEQYYIAQIEHYPEDILTPQYIEDAASISLCIDDKSIGEVLIDDIYAFTDMRDSYTIIIDDCIDSFTHKVGYYLIYEKYLAYKLSVSYEVWKNADKSIEVSPFFWLKCKVSQMLLNDTETIKDAVLNYRIYVGNLLKTSILKPIYFYSWNGKVSIDGLKVTLKE